MIYPDSVISLYFFLIFIIRPYLTCISDQNAINHLLEPYVIRTDLGTINELS